MAYQPGQPGGFARRLATETKQAFKTTEFWVFLALVVMILVAANTIEGEEGGGDYFAGDKAWLYVTILGSAYLISRGLAKSGSREPYTEQPGGGSGAPLTERVKTAATVLKEGETQSDQSGQPSGQVG